MSGMNVDNLVPTSTDMLVDFLGNSDKIVDSDKRWKYVDHRNSPYSSTGGGQGSGQNYGHSGGADNTEMDEDVDDYIPRGAVFSKGDTHTHNDTEYTQTATEGMTGTAGARTDVDSENPTLFDSSKRAPMTKDELMLAKLNMLRKLGELKQLGVKLSQNYGLDSDLKMMEYEYKLHTDIRAKQNSVQWMGHMLIGIIKGGEMLNDNYNPFDIKLEGLSTKISADMNSYYAVLGEIYEKYNQPGKQMAPEFKLLMMITGAVLSMQVNRALPGFMGGIATSVQTDTSIKEDLRRKAAVESHNDEKSNKSNKSAKSNRSGKSAKANQTYAQQQHAAAAQQVADLKYIREKQEELERSLKLAESARQKGGFILSSEAPESETDRKFTKEEIEMLRREKEVREIKHLEMLRQKAQLNSHAYRTGSSYDKATDLDRQAKNLDDILGSLEDAHDMHDDEHEHIEKSMPKSTPKTTSKTIAKTTSKTAKPTKPTKPTKTTKVAPKASPKVAPKTTPKAISKTSPKPAPKSAQDNRASESDTRSERSEQSERSDYSTSSSVSFNPKLQKIMDTTAHKGSTKTAKTAMPSKPTKTANPAKAVKKSNTRTRQVIDYNSIDRDSISFGSSSTDKKENVSPKQDDYGTISFGSSKKGVVQTIVTGK